LSYSIIIDQEVIVKGAFRLRQNLKTGVSGLEINKKAFISEFTSGKHLFSLKPKAKRPSNAVLLKRRAHL